jgi:hypothetical protein
MVGICPPPPMQPQVPPMAGRETYLIFIIQVSYLWITTDNICVVTEIREVPAMTDKNSLLLRPDLRREEFWHQTVSSGCCIQCAYEMRADTWSAYNFSTLNKKRVFVLRAKIAQSEERLRYGPDDRGNRVRFQVGVWDISVLHSLQTSSGVNSASHWKIQVTSPENKAAWMCSGHIRSTSLCCGAQLSTWRAFTYLWFI